ncbi:MAG: DUF421 domain-containing protein [Saprospiraceae bacterium]
MEKLFDTSIEELMRVIFSALIIYILIITFIRILGKRSTSELNTFDWIVTVSVGSIFASTIVLEDVSIPEGALSILALFLLQFAITKMMFHSSKTRRLVKSTPRLLLFEGKFLEENLRKERVLKSEVYAAIRQEGLKSISQIYAVVLETKSRLSIIPNHNPKELGHSLNDVHGLPNSLMDALEKEAEGELSKKD